MKILIIGGTGTISTAVTTLLLEKGSDVTLYNRGNGKIDGARCITGNRNDYASFEETMKKSGEFDCVIDMVNYTPEDAESVVRAFKGRLGQFIFCSTVDVYKKPAGMYPVKEDFQRGADPAFEYAHNKVLCENILEEAGNRGDFALTILRPAATYQDSSTPISLLGPGTALLKRIRRGEPVIVLGDGTSFWTSCHRDDVGKAFAQAVCNPDTYGKAYNVTGDEWMTWEEYYTTAARAMNAPATKFIPIPAGLLARMAPKSAEWCPLNFKFNSIYDNSAAKKDLNFKYTITWTEGVRRMIELHDGKGEIDGSPEYPLYDLIIQSYEEAGRKLAEELSLLDK